MERLVLLLVHCVSPTQTALTVIQEHSYDAGETSLQLRSVKAAVILVQCLMMIINLFCGSF